MFVLQNVGRGIIVPRDVSMVPNPRVDKGGITHYSDELPNNSLAKEVIKKKFIFFTIIKRCFSLRVMVRIYIVWREITVQGNTHF